MKSEVRPGAKDFPACLTVLIADDHALVREGLKLSLHSLDRDVVVLEADTLASAVDAFRAYREIDLVLLDLSMPGSRAGTALDDFLDCCPEARIVVVSATCDLATVHAALRKSVLGFIPKLAGKDVFLSAVRLVLDGGIYIPPEALAQPGEISPAVPLAAAPQGQHAAASPSRAQRAAANEAAALISKLTARQIDVLAQLLEGKPNKQICRELNLALGTVKCHVGAILDALEVNSRAEAIAAADKFGWRQWLAQPRVGSDEHVSPQLP